MTTRTVPDISAAEQDALKQDAREFLGRTGAKALIPVDNNGRLCKTMHISRRSPRTDTDKRIAAGCIEPSDREERRRTRRNCPMPG